LLKEATLAVEWTITIEGKNEFGDACRRKVRIDKNWEHLFDGEVGLSIEEGKKIMTALQSAVVNHEAETYSVFRRVCPHCSCSDPEKVRPNSPRYPLHHGRGVGGQLVFPQTNRTARPSPMRMLPTSFPSTCNIPQERPWLHSLVPSVPGAHAHATFVSRALPLPTSSRSRDEARSPNLRS
jgi:hypothetical protein